MVSFLLNGDLLGSNFGSISKGNEGGTVFVRQMEEENERNRMGLYGVAGVVSI